ncbi:diguanylate cyclase [Terriglobus sp. TAA 43]|uniref:GGDEF domain-containing protein n=1 Tax=Terriglobus sp. TAA 43 TaxID=278961 RepID=UPI0006459182|nr:diguanylate cyclase [Terriglobus sp. TAA 43]
MSTKNETQEYLSRSHGLAFALGFLVIHGVSLALFPAQRTVISHVFSIVVVAIALIFCIARTRSATPDTRLYWQLFSAAIFLWECGSARAAWEEVVLHSDISQASYADLPYFLYGVPIVLAISIPERKERVPLFVWLDTVQISVAATLTYLLIFTTFPFWGKPVHPISDSVLAFAYATENVVLALAAALRLISISKEDMRGFFRTLNIFLWTYGFFAILYNQLDLILQGVMDYVALLSDVPFLVLILVLTVQQPAAKERASDDQQPLGQFIRHASPVFFTLILIALGLAVIRTHFYIGSGAIVLAALIYGTRVTVLQLRYMHSQRNLQEARDQLETLSLTDALTGLANRRSLDLSLDHEWRKNNEAHTSFSLLMIDIDHFKLLNDHYGHAHGDECLRLISASLQRSLRQATDIAARLGGEEFTVLLPETNAESAWQTAERIRTNVEALKLPHTQTELGYITISIGVATHEGQHIGAPSDLLRAADNALYRAKHAGRNRTEQ